MTEYVFRSPQLRYRELTPDDADVMMRFHRQPEVMRYLGMPVWTEMEVCLDYIFRNMKSYRQNGFGRWVIESREGEWLGLAGLLEDEQEHFIDLGYRLFPEFWGKGLATEAAGAVLKYGFESLGLTEVKAHVHVANTASEKVLKKIGMQFIGDGVSMGLPIRMFELNNKGYRQLITAKSQHPQ